MSFRRKGIEKFCRMFLCGELESCRRIYKHRLRALYTNPGPSVDMKDYIENVGKELFDARPAETAYVLTFLEFVLQTYENMNNISIDFFVTCASNVLEKTTFDPLAHDRYMNVSVIFQSVITIYIMFYLIKMIVLK